MEPNPYLLNKDLLIWGCFFSSVIVIAAFNYVILSPLVFKFFIIPEIEKKIGEKLVYEGIAQYQMPLFIYASWQVSSYIVMACLRHRLKKRNIELKKFRKDWTLKKVNYSVEEFSKKEIRWSFFLIINMLLLMIFSAVALLFLPH